MTFKYPGLLYLLTVLVPMVAYYIWKHRNASPYLEVSSTDAFARIPGGWKPKALHLLFVLRCVAVAALIVALARPLTFNHSSKTQVEGTDIAIALDISGTMTTTDIAPTRLDAARKVAAEFINARENDNMALVIFAGESLTLLPLTGDRATLLGQLERIHPGQLPDGTAIGDGLASAINRVAGGKAKSKSVILLTDGSNNAGDVAPSTAAEIARSKGIRVYTIGVGTNGTYAIRDPFGFTTQMETRIDEQTLRQIAKATGGKYFRATSNRVLNEVFAEIDSLEKTRLDVERNTRTTEDFMPWLIVAFCALVLEILLRHTLLRRIP